jgi:hypothetical protein
VRLLSLCEAEPLERRSSFRITRVRRFTSGLIE